MFDGRAYVHATSPRPRCHNWACIDTRGCQLNASAKLGGMAAFAPSLPPPPFSLPRFVCAEATRFRGCPHCSPAQCADAWHVILDALAHKAARALKCACGEWQVVGLHKADANTLSLSRSLSFLFSLSLDAFRHALLCDALLRQPRPDTQILARGSATSNTREMQTTTADALSIGVAPSFPQLRLDTPAQHAVLHRLGQRQGGQQREGGRLLLAMSNASSCALAHRCLFEL